MFKVNYYFIIDKQANMAHDVETGEPAEAYAKFGIDCRQPIDEDSGLYESLKSEAAKLVSNTFKIKLEWLKPISHEEYLEHSYEEEE